MATVRFSDDLRSDILSNARSMFNKQVADAEANHFNTWGMLVYNLMYSDTKEQMNALPEGFMAVSSHMEIRGFKGAGWEELARINQSVDTKFSTPMRITNTKHHESMGLHDDGSTYGSSGYLNAADPRWDEFKVEYIAYCHNIMGIEARRDAFVAGVEKILNTYSTLGPALKAWSPLWELVPEAKKQKHLEVVERKSKVAPVIEGVDLDAMTGITVAAKLTGSN